MNAGAVIGVTLAVSDTQKPTTPGTPVVSNVDVYGNATVTVPASTDNVGVVGYAVFVDGKPDPYKTSVTHVIELSELSDGLHNVTVRAFDSAGNYSDESIISVFTVFLKMPRDNVQSSGNVIINYNFGTLNHISNNPGESAEIVYFLGEKFIECQLSTSPSSLFITEFVLSKNVFFGGFKTIQMPIWFDDMSPTEILNMLCQCWLYLSDGTSFRPQITLKFQEPGLFVASFSRDSLFAGAVAPSQLDELEVTKMRLLITSGTSAIVKSKLRFGQLYSGARLKKGGVLLYLDGQYDSQRDYIIPMLNANGLKANLAITNKDIGGAGRMDLDDLKVAYSQGHVLCHHTFGASSTGWDDVTAYPDSASITDDLRQQWAFLEDNKMPRGIGHCVNGFSNAFTNTVSNERQKMISAALVAGGMKTVRVGGNYLSAGAGVGMTFPLAHRLVNKRRIYGGRQISNLDTELNIIAIIDACIDRAEIATIVIHRSVLNAVSPGALEMKNQNMRLWIDYLGEKVSAGLISNITVDQLN